MPHGGQTLVPIHHAWWPMTTTTAPARLWLIGLIVGVPLLGFGVSTGLRAYFNVQVRDAIVAQVPDADPARVATFTVAELCETPSAITADLCQTNDQLGVMQSASVAVCGIGLGLLGLIALAGKAAQTNRVLLLAIFRPGLYVTAVTITGLVLAHAGLAMAVLYYGESALLSRVHVGIILTIGVGALTGVAAIAQTAFGVVKTAETETFGRVMSPEEAPGLWNQTAHVAHKLGALMPDHIVVGLDPTFFVTEASVNTLDGRLAGRTLFCSLPLARILTVDEFAAIIGHELGHFRGEDTKFSEQFYPIYRGTSTAIESLQSAGGDGVGATALLPAIAIFGYFLERFAIAESLNSRARELLADEAGAAATSPRAMASALVKVHAFAGIWNDVARESAEALRSATASPNASVQFAEAVSARAGEAALEGIAESQTSHPTDSHPTLAVRLAALNIDLASVTSEALDVRPMSAAVALIANAEAQERTLTTDYQQLLTVVLGINAESSGAADEDSQTGVAGASLSEDDAPPRRRSGDDARS